MAGSPHPDWRDPDPPDAGRGTLSDRVTNAVVHAAIRGALVLPWRWRLVLFGRFVAWVAAPAAGYDARARANLARIFPEMDAGAVRRLARAASDNVGRTLIETYSGAGFQRHLAGTPVTGEGLAALAAARAAGRPVILVSGHFGNYEAARIALVTAGYPVGGLYRPMRNPYFNAHYVRTLEQVGPPVFPQGAAGTKGFVRHLRAGGLLVLLMDQRAPRGPALDFLGHPALTALSAAELALRYGAVLVPFYGIRQPDGVTFRVEVEAPIPPSDAVTMTQALNDSLAARVRANPAQYFWIHRRWKPARPTRRQRARAAATTGP